MHYLELMQYKLCTIETVILTPDFVAHLVAHRPTMSYDKRLVRHQNTSLFFVTIYTASALKPLWLIVAPLFT